MVSNACFDEIYQTRDEIFYHNIQQRKECSNNWLLAEFIFVREIWAVGCRQSDESQFVECVTH